MAATCGGREPFTTRAARSFIRTRSRVTTRPSGAARFLPSQRRLNSAATARRSAHELGAAGGTGERVVREPRAFASRPGAPAPGTRVAGELATTQTERERVRRARGPRGRGP